MKIVVQLMRAGWELARTGGWGAGAWLQQGKVGYGGETRRVSSSTFFGLYDRGLLKQVRKTTSSATVHHLSKRGLEIDATS
jgi:hypothetical protein